MSDLYHWACVADVCVCRDKFECPHGNFRQISTTKIAPPEAGTISLRAKIDEEFQRGRQESWEQAQATIDGLRAKLANEAEQSKICLDSYAAENQRFSDEIESLRAAACQDAEKITELKSCMDISRQANVELAVEIARLTKLLAWMVEWFGDDDPTAQVVIDSRATLACRLQGERSEM